VQQSLQIRLRIQLVHEFLHLLLIQRLHGQEGVHEKAVAPRSRDPASGGVRRHHQPQRFEVGENVSRSGRTDAEAGGLHQRSGAYRLPILDMPLHQRLEQLLRTSTYGRLFRHRKTNLVRKAMKK